MHIGLFPIMSYNLHITKNVLEKMLKTSRRFRVDLVDKVLIMNPQLEVFQIDVKEI